MIPAHPRSVHQLIENKARSKHEANLMCEPLTPALDEYSHLYSRTVVYFRCNSVFYMLDKYEITQSFANSQHNIWPIFQTFLIRLYF